MYRYPYLSFSKMAEKLTDVELESVALHHAAPRSLGKASASSLTQVSKLSIIEDFSKVG